MGATRDLFALQTQVLKSVVTWRARASSAAARSPAAAAAMSVLAALLLVVVLLALLVVAASCRRFGTWRRKGIPHPRPLPLFGNCIDAVLLRTSFYEALDKIYRQFPGQPYIGFYGGSSPMLLVCGSEAVKDITVKDFHVFTDHKLSPDSRYDTLFSKFLFCLLGDQWKSIRARQTPAFSSGRLKAMFPTVKATADRLCEVIDKRLDKDGAVGINGLCSRYGIDVIAAVAFGIEARALDSDEPPPFMKAVSAALRFGPLEALITLALLFSSPVYHVLRAPIIKEWRAVVLRGLLREATELREREPPRKDVFDTLLSLKKDGDVPQVVFEAQVMSMQVAGSETSSTAVLAILWELALNQDCQDRLREELREAVAKQGAVTYELLHDAEYLDMVFKEAVRLWPVMPWLDRVASEDYVLPGTNAVIEKGTVIIIPIFSFHRDPERFDDPDTFKPERWAPENVAKIDKMSYLPFGNGPRACIGFRFANMSVKSAVASVVLKYRIGMAEGTPKSHAELELSPLSFIISPHKELPLRFERL